MSVKSIAFIGGGNMATSLIGGLIANGSAPDTIWVADPDRAKLEALQTRFEVRTSADNLVVIRRAETLLFAVKPQVMGEVVRGVAEVVRECEPLLISIVAGVRESAILHWLGCEAAVVRAMPNTPALVGSGATALYANRFVSAERRSAAESVLRAAGITLWVEDEGQLDAVTAVSGSGPAYYFQLMELMEEAGCRVGLDRGTARMLVLQTALGAARMALESSDPPATLRARVTSPGGTTERAIKVLDDGGLRQLYIAAIEAARDRAAELGEILGKD